MLSGRMSKELGIGRETRTVDSENMRKCVILEPQTCSSSAPCGPSGALFELLYHAFADRTATLI